ncbi:SH3 domain-containing protein [Bradyrhizobium sp.]|uniref:SH3 domain-containing protein n=1 Tax=Bradyrhizobium sp. TaxID=376 RepID=UPI002608EC45|nr:SH3 domain-containing protein [Bradyrhizobium sp.]
MKLKAVLTAALLLAPTAALAAPGIVTESVGLRAGPGPGFPMVDRIPGGARVNVHGCLRGDAWCDVSWSDDRGWVSSQYLEYLYHDAYVYLPDYVDEVDVPIVPFVLSSYWSSYYSGRPWYHRRAHWSTYWNSHERAASRMTINRSAARIGREATRNAAAAKGRTPRGGMAERATRGERNAAQFRGAREAQGREARGRQVGAQARMGQQRTGRERMNHERMGHKGGAARANARMQPPMARAHQATRSSAAPAARPMQHVAKPNIGRGSPMNAHAQTPMPHAAPAMPHGGGGAPHINAAQRGAVRAGGGGHGHEHR